MSSERRRFKAIGWVSALIAVAWSLGCDQAAPFDPSGLDPKRGLFETSDSLVVVDLKGERFDPLVWNNTGSEKAWSLKGGVIRSDGATNRPLWLMTPRLQSHVRIEFKARTLSEQGELRFEVFGDGEHHESGYVLVFGAWGNVAHIIARMDEHWSDADGFSELSEQARSMSLENTAVEPGRWYSMSIVRTDAELRWFVDGELLLSYIDPEPLAGPGHDRFGVSSWASSVEITNLRVVPLQGSAYGEGEP